MGVDITEINPNIRKLVKWLNANCFKTTDSGDGSNYEAGMEGALPFPMVAIVVAPEEIISETDRLCILMSKQFGLRFGAEPEGPNIEASYNPGDGHTMIVLTNVDDSMLGFLHW